MIEINLLPEEFKKEESRQKKLDLSKLDIKKSAVLKVAGAFLASLISVHLVVFCIGFFNKGNLDRLSRRYDAILPREKEADSLKSEINIINRKVKAINELMVRRFSWAGKLNALSDSMTVGIWLTELSYDERLVERPVQGSSKPITATAKAETGAPGGTERVVLGYMTIAGYASSMGEQGTALVGKFIKSLKDNNAFYSDFANIELGAIKSDKIMGQEVMNFRITCFFKEAR